MLEVRSSGKGGGGKAFARFASVFLAGCLGVLVLALATCVGSIWYVATQAKEAIVSFQQARQTAEAQIEKQKDPDIIPAWVTSYPNVQPQDAFLSASEGAGSGFFRLEVPIPLGDLVNHVKAHAREQGFVVQTTRPTSGTPLQVIAMVDDRVVLASMLNDGPGRARATIRYSWGPEGRS